MRKSIARNDGDPLYEDDRPMEGGVKRPLLDSDYAQLPRPVLGSPPPVAKAGPTSCGEYTRADAVVVHGDGARARKN